MSEKPISPLRQRMIEDMTVRNFGEKTHNVCTQCGIIGADVRPDWSPHVNSRFRSAEALNHSVKRAVSLEL
jgi:hypothetical protein